MNVLVVVDMQKDFISGPLGTEKAAANVQAVRERILQAKKLGETVIFLRDTHQENYLETQEGRRLPVPHTLEGTEGWEIVDALAPLAAGELVINKPTFGSVAMGETLRELNEKEPVETITFVGIYTDMCVLSNVLLAKAFLTEARIVVDASCCVGLSDEAHWNAIGTMKICQVDIINE